MQGTSLKFIRFARNTLYDRASGRNARNPSIQRFRGPAISGVGRSVLKFKLKGARDSFLVSDRSTRDPRLLARDLPATQGADPSARYFSSL